MPCPPGFYCDMEGTINPMMCPENHYCPMETAEPNMCPDGTFSSWTGSANSADCQEIVSSEEE